MNKGCLRIIGAFVLVVIGLYSLAEWLDGDDLVDAPVVQVTATDVIAGDVAPTATDVPEDEPPMLSTMDTQGRLESIQIEVVLRGLVLIEMPEVVITDERANGGERRATVSFVLSSPLDLSVATLGVHDAVLNNDIDLDTVAFIWRETADGDDVGRAEWYMEDIEAYWAEKIDADTFFLERMR